MRTIKLKRLSNCIYYVLFIHKAIVRGEPEDACRKLIKMAIIAYFHPNNQFYLHHFRLAIDSSALLATTGNRGKPM